MSDSSYTAVTRHRRPLSTAGRPHQLDVVDDAWAAATLSDDEVDVERQEAAIAPLIEEEGEDVDAVVVSTGHSSGSAADGAAERRRRWNDLGLDQLDANQNGGTAGGGRGNAGRG